MGSFFYLIVGSFFLIVGSFSSYCGFVLFYCGFTFSYPQKLKPVLSLTPSRKSLSRVQSNNNRWAGKSSFFFHWSVIDHSLPAAHISVGAIRDRQSGSSIMCGFGILCSGTSRCGVGSGGRSHVGGGSTFSGAGRVAGYAISFKRRRM